MSEFLTAFGGTRRRFHGRPWVGWSLAALLLAGPGAAAPNPQALVDRAQDRFARGDIPGAISAFSAAIAHEPKNARLYYQRGVCRERLARSSAALLDSAEEDYQRALALDPRLARAHNNLGALLYHMADGASAKDQRSRYARAKHHLDRAVSLRPGYAAAWFNLGLLRAAMGKPADAVLAYRRAVALTPKDVDVRINLANALAAQGQIDDALEQVRRAAKVAPRNALVAGAVADLLIKKGQPREAEVQLRRAIALDPGYVRPRLRLALLLARRGEFAGGLQQLKAAEGRAPRDAGVQIAFGRLYRRWGKNAQAILRYQRALDLDPGRSRAHLLIGLAHAAEGHCNRAREAFLMFDKKTQLLKKDGVRKLMKRCRSPKPARRP